MMYTVIVRLWWCTLWLQSGFAQSVFNYEVNKSYTTFEKQSVKENIIPKYSLWVWRGTLRINFSSILIIRISLNYITLIWKKLTVWYLLTSKGAAWKVSTALLYHRLCGLSDTLSSVLGENIAEYDDWLVVQMVVMMVVVGCGGGGGGGGGSEGGGGTNSGGW